MSVNIRLTGMEHRPWLEAYDPEAHDGRGLVISTFDRKKAMVFADPNEAFKLYRAVPSNHPLRDDGKPNRPLTAYTVEIVDVNEEPLL